MYKVVIIDDEPIIVEGLSKSIAWQNWDCQVVASAGSGEEGLEIIHREKPDILFSDIRMPGMSGLEMIAALKSEYPHMEITILTGHRDFEYAQEAIRMGVTRFLLKPSKMDELREAVDAMCANLRESEKVRILYDQMQEIAPPSESEAVEEESEEMSDTAGSFIVNQALKYMEENYTQKLKLSDVADHVYVSQWHLSKLLNKYTEKSFSDLLNHVRIEKAKELLRDPSLRIGDIADQVGFLDMAHFSRVFKKQAGISANEYRNRLS